jgi:hypothetical protein
MLPRPARPRNPAAARRSPSRAGHPRRHRRSGLRPEPAGDDLTALAIAAGRGGTRNQGRPGAGGARQARRTTGQLAPVSYRYQHHRYRYQHHGTDS